MDPTAPRRRTPSGGASVAARPVQRRHVSGPAGPVLATPPPGAAEPGIGDLVGGRYRIGAELGYGGMARVYRAHDERLQRDVAIKVFRSGVAEAVDPKRTTREMHIVASLSHPAVVSVLDASDDPRSGTYLVMELVDGDDLGSLLRKGPLPPEQARRIAGDVAAALEALHARSIVHRDVKPANILVLSAAAAASGGVAAKLTDFGIAQLIDGTRITAPESILGTAAYLSPEQVRSEPVGRASDVYSLGLVLLECLTGVRAFPGGGAETAVARLTRAPAIPASASAGLTDLLRRMTALDPAARPDAGEVAEQLRENLVGGMLAGEDARTAQTPALPMPVVAAASLPLATGPVRATGVVPAGSAVASGTGGVGAVPPHDYADDRLEATHRRRRLAMLSGLIGGFAALIATAAVVVAMSSGTGATVAPDQPRTTSVPSSAPAPSRQAASRAPAGGSRAAVAATGAAASSTPTASSRRTASSTSTSSSSSATTPPAGSTTASSSASPSSGSSSSGTPSAGPSGGTGTTPTAGTTSSPPASSSPSSGSGTSSSPSVTLSVPSGGGG